MCGCFCVCNMESRLERPLFFYFPVAGWLLGITKSVSWRTFLKMIEIKGQYLHISQHTLHVSGSCALVTSSPLQSWLPVQKQQLTFISLSCHWCSLACWPLWRFKQAKFLPYVCLPSGWDFTETDDSLFQLQPLAICKERDIKFAKKEKYITST